MDGGETSRFPSSTDIANLLQVVFLPRGARLHAELLGHRVRPGGAQRQQGRPPPRRRHRGLPRQREGARLGLRFRVPSGEGTLIRIYRVRITFPNFANVYCLHFVVAFTFRSS